MLAPVISDLPKRAVHQVEISCAEVVESAEQIAQMIRACPALMVQGYTCRCNASCAVRSFLSIVTSGTIVKR